MSSEAEPISLPRFIEALADLPLSALRLKTLEIRNSVSHLIYSNAELKPFAEADPPDEVCAEAIRENEVVLERMMGRIAALKDEVEKRGGNWAEFEVGPIATGTADSGDERDAADNADTAREGGDEGRETNGVEEGSGAHPAWSDGTFRVGTLRAAPAADGERQNGTGGTLSDAELVRQLEERMRVLDEEEGDTAENGVHL
ncbi:uncharacterized protein DNG_00529 [Cephalotrichum gorgonifer]|uniref:Uncharacterized protein n=1 Tax=Cephalotrichum gorgonifer TaxID=2041049 RepID=A0AAE8SRB1_9PEZI|nr:uncharacterized protein DNG_00529 [Cephalotrichum gorgonifer]